MGPRPKLVLVGGDGGRSGVPRHIAQLCTVLTPWADVTILSDRDRGGYGFARAFRHVEVQGLATSLNPVTGFRAQRALTDVLRDIGPDLVWAHARMALPLSRWSMRKGGLGRLMVTYHGLPFGPGHGVLRSSVSLGLERVGLRLGPRQDLVFLTAEDRDAMPEGLTRGHCVHLLANSSVLGGFATDSGPRSGPRRLIMLTRDSWQKNLDLAARIFAVLPPDFLLELYGMGTDSAALKARMAAVLAPEAVARVRFGGPTDQVGPALARSDGLLVTSRYEGLSIAMIEAMEMGVPVFSTKVGGTALIGAVHPLFGALSEHPWQSAGVIDRMTRTFRSDAAAWQRATHQAWVGAFGPDQWAGRVNELVQEVLNRNP